MLNPYQWICLAIFCGVATKSDATEDSLAVDAELDSFLIDYIILLAENFNNCSQRPQVSWASASHSNRLWELKTEFKSCIADRFNISGRSDDPKLGIAKKVCEQWSAIEDCVGSSYIATPHCWTGKKPFASISYAASRFLCGAKNGGENFKLLKDEVIQHQHRSSTRSCRYLTGNYQMVYVPLCIRRLGYADGLAHIDNDDELCRALIAPIKCLDELKCNKPGHHFLPNLVRAAAAPFCSEARKISGLEALLIVVLISKVFELIIYEKYVHIL